MRLVRTTLGMILFLCLVAGTATAQDDTEPPLVDRGADELTDAVDIRSDDVDFVDTALVFTNLSDRDATVRCRGFDVDGNEVGSIKVMPPAAGLRFVFASDLSGGVDFAGRVVCVGRGRLTGTALLLGATGVSDLPVQGGRRGMVFPVVVTR